jgi:hypothetical protein
MSDATTGCTLVPAGSDTLQKQIERQIILSTWGRIHDLKVEVTSDSLCVRARTPSHYIKQLVLHAIYEVVGTNTTLSIELDIQVGKPVRHVLPGDNDLWGVPHD